MKKSTKAIIILSLIIVLLILVGGLVIFVFVRDNNNLKEELKEAQSEENIEVEEKTNNSKKNNTDKEDDDDYDYVKKKIQEKNVYDVVIKATEMNASIKEVKLSGDTEDNISKNEKNTKNTKKELDSYIDSDKRTDLASMESSLQCALSALSVDFVANEWQENQDLVFSETLTYGKLNDELKEMDVSIVDYDKSMKDKLVFENNKTEAKFQIQEIEK